MVSGMPRSRPGEGLSMDAETNRQLAFIVDELEKSLGFFYRKRNYNRIVTSLFIAGGASLSAIATIALGASRMTQVTWLAVVALVASGLATVVVALEALFAHRRLWSINNVALAELEKLKRDLEYRRAPTPPRALRPCRKLPSQLVSRRSAWRCLPCAVSASARSRLTRVVSWCRSAAWNWCHAPASPRSAASSRPSRRQIRASSHGIASCGGPSPDWRYRRRERTRRPSACSPSPQSLGDHTRARRAARSSRRACPRPTV